jgi:excisionase family DNA binding protein
MAVRRRPGLTYTAQDVARFCEVDLKTVHHWAERGRVPHYRTDGRHLRFRRNDLVNFLRAHGYPLPEAVASVRPKIISTIADDELGKKLSSRFTVRRLDSAVLAVARIVADEPDAVVFALDDPSFAGIPALVALKRDPATSWVALAVSAPAELVAAAKDAGADVAVPHEDAVRLASELGRTLAAN